MQRNHRIIAGLAAAAALIATGAVYAHQGGEGAMEHGAMHGAMGQGMQGMHAMHAMQGGMGQGMQGHGMGVGMGQGAMGQGRGAPGAAQQLMSPEERTAMQEKMRSAKTPEERQKLAQANRAEMEKRAKEKGITLPEQRGPGAGMGPQSGTHQH